MAVRNRSQIALTKIAALKTSADELAKRRMLWDGTGQNLVLDIYQRCEPLLIELGQSDPELFGDSIIREKVELAPAVMRDFLNLLRSDMQYALDLGIQHGLCERERVLPQPAAGAAAEKAEKREAHFTKLVYTVLGGVITAAIIYGLGIK